MLKESILKNIFNNTESYTIPRYIIIDKTGKIINDNAPRPSDPKLKILLDKLLAE